MALRGSSTLAAVAAIVALAVGSSHLRGGRSSSSESSFALDCPPAVAKQRRRSIFIGDVHGAAAGLREILVADGVVNRTVPGCARLPSAMDTVVVQLGDLVDRGRHALEAWDCLDELQRTSEALEKDEGAGEGGIEGRGSTVVRLLGNHELMWLQGRFHSSKDSEADRRALTLRIRRDVLEGRVVGAAALSGGQLLVTHAGLRRAMLEDVILRDMRQQAAAEKKDGWSSSSSSSSSGGYGGGDGEGGGAAVAAVDFEEEEEKEETPSAAVVVRVAEHIRAELVAAVRRCADGPPPGPALSTADDVAAAADAAVADAQRLLSRRASAVDGSASSSSSSSSEGPSKAELRAMRLLKTYSKLGKKRFRQVFAQLSPPTLPVVCDEALDAELFEAGPERGGSSIGGPFWTDFRVVKDAWKEEDAEKAGSAWLGTGGGALRVMAGAVGDALVGWAGAGAGSAAPKATSGDHDYDDHNSSSSSSSSSSMMEKNRRHHHHHQNLLGAVTQIVGHSAADCDVKDDPEGCQPIRSARRSLAVDGAMYWGNRAYLELTAGGHFMSHTKAGSPSDAEDQAPGSGSDGGSSSSKPPRQSSFSASLREHDLGADPEAVWIARNLTEGNACGQPVATRWAVTAGEVFALPSPKTSGKAGSASAAASASSSTSLDSGDGDGEAPEAGSAAGRIRSIFRGVKNLLRLQKSGEAGSSEGAEGASELQQPEGEGQAPRRFSERQRKKEARKRRLQRIHEAIKKGRQQSRTRTKK